MDAVVSLTILSVEGRGRFRFLSRSIVTGSIHFLRSKMLSTKQTHNPRHITHSTLLHLLWFGPDRYEIGDTHPFKLTGLECGTERRPLSGLSTNIIWSRRPMDPLNFDARPNTRDPMPPRPLASHRIPQPCWTRSGQQNATEEYI